MSNANPAVVALRFLCNQYPVFSERRPLAIGIAKALIARHPEIRRSDIQSALRLHTRSVGYMKAVAKGGSRFDLDLNACGAISPAQVSYATESLKNRFAKKVTIARAEKAALQAQRNREIKLHMLIQRFAKH